MKKIFTDGLGTGTNAFASIPTGHQLFEETCLFRKGSYGKNVPMFGAPLAVWRQRAEAKGWQVVESLCAFAQPAGKTVKKVYEAFRDEIVAELRAGMAGRGCGSLGCSWRCRARWSPRAMTTAKATCSPMSARWSAATSRSASS